MLSGGSGLLIFLPIGALSLTDTSKWNLNQHHRQWANVKNTLLSIPKGTDPDVVPSKFNPHAISPSLCRATEGRAVDILSGPCH